MKGKLYPNIRRLTNLFCIGILCVTLSVLTLRLTVFSSMAGTPPKAAANHMLLSEQDGYEINGRIYFSTTDSKGDVFITNLEGNTSVLQVDITLNSNGKSILTTGFINPGVTMGTAKLNPTGQKLKDGVYDCVAEITALDPNSFKAMGSAKETLQIYIGVRPE